jgi:hypothetical protein
MRVRAYQRRRLRDQDAEMALLKERVEVSEREVGLLSEKLRAAGIEGR